MNWQKARIIKAADNGLLKVGMEVWVEVGPPRDFSQEASIADPFGKILGGADRPRFKVAIEPCFPGCVAMVIRADLVELLARGPEDFADEVEFMTLEDLRNYTSPTTAPEQNQKEKQ